MTEQTEHRVRKGSQPTACMNEHQRARLGLWARVLAYQQGGEGWGGGSRAQELPEQTGPGLTSSSTRVVLPGDVFLLKLPLEEGSSDLKPLNSMSCVLSRSPPSSSFLCFCEMCMDKSAASLPWPGSSPGGDSGSCWKDDTQS